MVAPSRLFAVPNRKIPETVPWIGGPWTRTLMGSPT